MEVNPHSRPALAGLAGAMALKSAPDEMPQAMLERLLIARKMAEQAVVEDTDYADSYVTLGSILNQLSDVYRALGMNADSATASAQAIDADRTAMRLDPDKPEVLNKLGGLLAQAGQVVEAERLLRRAIELDPTLSQAHLNLGALLQREHRLDEALEQIRLAVGLDGNDPLGRMNYAVLLHMHGEHAAALEQIEIARRIDPNSPRIRDVYNKIAGGRR